MPPQYILRKSGVQNKKDINHYTNLYEQDGKLSINSAMQKLANRNSMQSKSQNKKPYNDIKNNINILSHTPGSKTNNYINLTNNNMNNIMSNINMSNISNISNNNMNNNINLLQNKNSNQIETKNDKIFMKTFQQKKITQNSSINNYQNGYRNRKIYTYQGNNDRANLNFVNNNNYFSSNSPIGIDSF